MKLDNNELLKVRPHECNKAYPEVFFMKVPPRIYHGIKKKRARREVSPRALSQSIYQTIRLDFITLQ